jgi:hypothetical protein
MPRPTASKAYSRIPSLGTPNRAMAKGKSMAKGKYKRKKEHTQPKEQVQPVVPLSEPERKEELSVDQKKLRWHSRFWNWMKRS